MYRMMVADFDSPSYFVATAAVKLGFFKEQGLDVEFVAEYGAKHGPERLREGYIHFFGGPAFAATRAFPAWKGVKLVAALAQHSYWFMGIRKDIDIRRGDIKALKGLRISTSFAFPCTALRHMLTQAGLDLSREEVRIVESLPSKSESHSLDGVRALRENLADCFWGNGMRLALAEKAGIAKLHLDLRRGDGPPDARHYNFAALTMTDALIEKEPEVAAAAVRAIVATQKALKADPKLAKKVGDELFPGDEAEMIPILVGRDAPFYDATITPIAVDGLNKFAMANGLLDRPLAYEQIAARQFEHIWRS
ncbi:ABC transporter substrate-binding protein [Rhodoplanes sp. Z2-YC6860]|uniref:ABC transporter substrate-binding protein n=1 Tax=Rhodoplanes sp. Z2-YC6860 TaxID=674703 RepID=UPI00078D73C6|nr:ABC transporter substrate-binding protein [Rhodoplanes sp. Z2-YC6860]AMN40528.1 nitrate/sulfonate/bicarbonate ABC transporter periplasmic protein [Rhodoplanes sp. Z2-YC6860]